MRRLWPVAIVLAACTDSENLSPVAPRLELDATAIDFGPAFVGFETRHELAIANRGDGILDVAAFSLEPLSPFAMLGVPARLAPGAGGTMTLGFTPVALGVTRGTLVIETNDGERSRIDVVLSGSGIEPPNCDDANSCTDDSFDPVLASCGHVPREGSCDDGSACTEADRCAEGSCIGDAIACDDDVECTRDLCDPATGCVYLPNDELCTDDDACSLDRCAPDGCENPRAPDGTPCGEYVMCDSIDVCIVGFCVGVSIPDGAPCSDGDSCTLADSCAAGACVGTATVTIPTVIAESFLFDDPSSATFVGDKWYVASKYDDARRFTVLGARGNDIAPVRAVRALDGSARMFELPDGLWARITTSTSGGHNYELIDATVPSSPVLVSRTPHAWGIDEKQPLTYNDGRLFYCASPTHTSWDASLVSVDLTDWRNPGPPMPLGPGPCRPNAVAAGAFWVVWENAAQGRRSSAGTAEDNRVSISPYANIRIWHLDANGMELVLDHTYDTLGSSMYGMIRTLALDGHRVLVDLEHPSWFFAIDLDQAAPALTAITINLGDPSQLAGLHDYTAYIHAAGQLRAVDLSIADQPVTLGYTLALPGWEDFARALAFSDNELALVSSGGRGFTIANRNIPGPVLPRTLRGFGSVDRLYRQRTGLHAVDHDSTLLYEPSWLLAPDPFTTPVARNWGALVTGSGIPVVVDGPDGTLGVYSARRTPDRCPSDQACEQTDAIGPSTRIPAIALLPNGDVALGPEHPIVRTDPNEQLWATAIDGCTGIVFASVAAPMSHSDRLLVVDHCGTPPPSLTSIAAIDLSSVSEYWDVTTHALRDGKHSALLADSAVLVDLTDPFVPTWIALPLGGKPLADAYDTGAWAIVVETSPGTSELQVWDVTGATPMLRGTAPLPAVDRSLSPRLWIEWPVAYLGLDAPPLAELRVFALDGAAPVPSYELSLPARPLQLVTDGNLLYLGRGDGISVLNTPCPSP